MLSERIYGALLHAFPAPFRESYEAETVSDFDALCRDRGPVSAWARVLADLAVSAPAQHLTMLGWDLRDAVRKLAASPGLVALVMLTLGLGAGANTAVYSLTDALLFRPLPAPQPDRLVTIGRAEGTSEPASYPDFVDLREANRTFAGLAAFEPMSVQLADGSRKDRAMCEIVSGNYFSVLRRNAAAGRLLAPEDDVRVGAHPVAVASYASWIRRFGGDVRIVGKEVRINGHRFTIVGVAPKEFRGSAIPLTAELWVPLSMYREAFPALRDRDANRDTRWLALIGRLKDGVTADQAAADVNAIDRRTRRASPAASEERRQRERELFVAPARGVLVQRRLTGLAATLMMAVTGLVLAIACLNVANLLLAHGTARRRELGIRIALGASRRRVLRQLLTENVVLSLLGAASGCGFAWVALRLLGDLKTPAAGPWQWSAHAAIDVRVLAYAVLVGAGTGLVFGVWPALQTVRADVHQAMKGWSVAAGVPRAAGRLRSALVIAQIAVSVALLAGAGLLARTLRNLHGTSPQFETGRQLMAQPDFNTVDYTRPAKERFLADAKRRITTVPGVAAVALVSNFVPLNLNPRTVMAPTADRSAAAGYALVEPEFFGVLGIPLIEGSVFGRREERVVINGTLAQRFWPGADPVGKRLRIGREDAPGFEIAGVARDAKYYSLSEAALPFVYLPYESEQARAEFELSARMFIRTAVAPASMAPAIREVFAKVDPAVEVRDVAPLERLVDFAIWPTRLAAQFLGGFSLLGLLLGAAGLYGVMSYTVERWTHEMGIRQAVGANAADVMRLVLRRGMRLAAVGLALGLPLAAALARLVRAMGHCSPHDYDVASSADLSYQVAGTLCYLTA